MNFKIVTDGSCDLPTELVEQLGITVVPFYVSFDSNTYRKEIEEIGIRDFYEEMVQNPTVYPKSSMPTAADFAAAFAPLAAAGCPILCLCITTKFSGSMQSALVAKTMTLEQYPEAQITVIDAQVNTVLQGLYVLEAAKLQQAGLPYETAVQRIEAIRASGRIFFTVGSLDYLDHGGRIGKVAGRVATLLGVLPLITLKEGEIFPSGIARGRKVAMSKVIALLQSYLAEQGLPLESYAICIGYGYHRDEATEFRAKLQEALAAFGTVPEIPLYQIGATIAVHTGPYPLGISIIRKADVSRP